MPPVDALQIWQQLSNSAECSEAVKHYGHNRGKEVLKQGAADFDQPYLTDYYVSEHGYMDMHLKQNLTAFRHCFEDEMLRDMLLVDFGCGPMTAGLALAEILSTQTPHYKADTAYFGIDASQNMVNKAQKINEEHELFEHFKVVQGTRFDATEIPHTFPKPPIIVLCFSFVLAPNTFKPDEQVGNPIEELANDWKQYVENQSVCRETQIIYLNPISTRRYLLHDNWRLYFEPTICTQDPAERFCYTSDDFTFPLVESLGKKISLQIIRGTRK